MDLPVTSLVSDRKTGMQNSYPPSLRPVDLSAAERRHAIAWGVRNGYENDDLAALAATLLNVSKCRRFAAKKPFPYSVLGLTPQAILFRRFAASKSTNRLHQ
jgi:hypothetical protein